VSLPLIATVPPPHGIEPQAILDAPAGAGNAVQDVDSQAERFVAVPDKSESFETLLAAYPEQIQDIAAALRKLIDETLPEPLEMVDMRARLVGYGFGQRYSDMVCSLIPSRGGVKLGLAYGASLPDPKGLLAGSGKVHRHMNFRTLADVSRPGVKTLLRLALAAQKQRAN